MVTEPVRWIQDSDPSPADSAVVHRSRRPCQEQPPPLSLPPVCFEEPKRPSRTHSRDCAQLRFRHEAEARCSFLLAQTLRARPLPQAPFEALGTLQRG